MLLIKPHTMKKSLLFGVALLMGLCSFAQLSTRTNYDGNFKLNTRPQAGDAALHFVIPIVDLSTDTIPDAGLYKGNSLIAEDLLTFKYYYTDDLVFRAGIRLAADNHIVNGTAVDSTSTNQINEEDEFETVNTRSILREYNLALGAEKHFTNDNIFDVYAGGEARIGLGKDRSVMEYTYFNGDVDNTSMTTNTSIFGVAGVVGFNVFVAELPISVGMEYGWSAKWIFGGTTKVERTQELDDADIDFSEEWEQVETDAFGDLDLNDLGLPRQYSSLSQRQFNMENNNSVRVNICIYFSTRNRNVGSPS